MPGSNRYLSVLSVLSALFPAVLGLSLSACVTRPVVAIDPDYEPRRGEKVVLTAFTDYPAMPGSGAAVSKTFETFLRGAYDLAAPIQIEGRGVNGVVLGSITEMTGSQQYDFHTTVAEHRRDPITVGRAGGPIAGPEGGAICATSYKTVTQTYSTPARVGLSVRMVDAETAQVLWVASASGEGDDVDDAMRQASYDLVRAVGRKIREQSKLDLARN